MAEVLPKHVCFHQTFRLFEIYSKHYEQKDGVAMGSPLGPLFPNIFLSFHKTSWLANSTSSFKPLHFCRYVDDCFIIFRSRDQVKPFLDYLNSQQNNINFSSEEEQIPFRFFTS